MSHKVLLADDSLTIQKVIKITLANQPYEIVEASSEDELFQKLTIFQPKIVFLDFNLSDKYTGYELTSKIKGLLPACKVLLLLGTFDSIDDAAFERSGASDKIVKPFDSNKFIAICKQLIDAIGEEPVKEKKPVEPASQKEASAPAAEDQWTVNHSTDHRLEAEPVKEEKPATSLNALESEISDWGMSVPGVIGATTPSEKMDLPPVIGSSSSSEKRADNYAAKLPSQEDLDYPTIEELSQSKDTQSHSNLISIDDFRQETSDYQLEGNYVAEESNVKSIQDQIRDEVESDLWKVDEFEDLKKEVSSKVEQISSSFETDDSLFRPIDDKASISWNDVAGMGEETASSHVNLNPHTGAMSNLHGTEMEDLIKKYVKEYMDELFKTKVEKVAWEVIPDLAENLIRQELNKIADKILKDSK